MGIRRPRAVGMVPCCMEVDVRGLAHPRQEDPQPGHGGGSGAGARTRPPARGRELQQPWLCARASGRTTSRGAAGVEARLAHGLAQHGAAPTGALLALALARLLVGDGAVVAVEDLGVEAGLLEAGFDLGVHPGPLALQDGQGGGDAVELQEVVLVLAQLVAVVVDAVVGEADVLVPVQVGLRVFGARRLVGENVRRPVVG